LKNSIIQPVSQEQAKVKKAIMISPKAVEILDTKAGLMGLNRSEVIEVLAHGLIGPPAKLDFSSEELKLIAKVVQLKLAFLEDELVGRGVFEDQELKGKDLSALSRQVDILHAALEKVVT